tara:strand:- start:11111 stop:11458 length:348 start_codon:yes stop_codon:yes gene_type:complete
MATITYVQSPYHKEIFEKGVAACNVSHGKKELNKTTYLRPKVLTELVENDTKSGYIQSEWLNSSQLAEILQVSKIVGYRRSAVLIVDSKEDMPTDLWQSLQQSCGFYPVLFEENP